MSVPETGIDRRAINALQVRDVFVLRRVEKDRFVHVGGVGRGEGWAGLTELRLHDNVSARSAYDENRIVELSSDEEIRVFGPYWSPWSAFVPVDHDVMVVFGGPGNNAPRDPGALQEMAAAAAKEIQVISPAKRLADELEILHAVQKLMASEPESTVGALQHVVDCATEALSCDYGIAWLPDGNNFAARERGWTPDCDLAQVAQALIDSAHRMTDAPVCVQDAATDSLPAPFLPGTGVRSYYLLPLGKVAALLLVHTQADARGFTQLCQELGRRLAESGEVLLRTAIQRESLAREVERVSTEARRDPLTRLANRLAWEERLDELVGDHVKVPCGVICIDLDHLKRVNDNLGHEAGDGHLQAMADIIRENVRPEDFVARLGGDEFAVLLPGAGAESCAKILSRFNKAANAHPGIEGFPIRYAYGMAVCEPGQSIHDTVREADANLIREKHER